MTLCPHISIFTRRRLETRHCVLSAFKMLKQSHTSYGNVLYLRILGQLLGDPSLKWRTKWTTLLSCSPASSLIYSRKQWWNELWSHGQFGVHETSSFFRNGRNLQTWSVIRGWTCCIIITTLLLLLSCNAQFLCLYLGTSCLLFPSVFSSYDLLLPVSVNGDPIPDLMPLRFIFSVLALFTCIPFSSF